MPLIDIKNLSVEFQTSQGTLQAVDGIDLTLKKGDVLGIVGESGSGKSVTMRAMMGLIGYPGIVKADKLMFDGHDLLTISEKEKRSIVGKDIAMIFQEPMTSLNPSYTVGFQIMETLKVHEKSTRAARKKRAAELLDLVGIPDPVKRLKSFPHQLSGGMNQRVMIAMAIACNPKVLIADEPTTALDVTIQAQILELLNKLQKETNMTLIMITHDMGVIAESVKQVMVMYAGQAMEIRKVEDLFSNPRHPYTNALLEALPERALGKNRLATIPGVVPGITDRPAGCLFNPRCNYSDEKKCVNERPALEKDTKGKIRCHYPLNSKETKKAS